MVRPTEGRALIELFPQRTQDVDWLREAVENRWVVITHYRQRLLPWRERPRDLTASAIMSAATAEVTPVPREISKNHGINAETDGKHQLQLTLVGQSSFALRRTPSFA